MPDPMTAEEYAAMQAREWTTYVARVPIDFYGVRAYNTGDPVPASAVVGEADGAWVPEHLVERISDDVPAFTGSQTVVDPAPPTINAAAVAAPLVASPAPVAAPVIPEQPTEPEASAPPAPAAAAPVAATPPATPATSPAVDPTTAPATTPTTPEV